MKLRINNNKNIFLTFNIPKINIVVTKIMETFL